MNKKERKQRIWSFVFTFFMMYLIGLIAVAGEKVNYRYFLWNILTSLVSTIILEIVSVYVNRRIVKREQRKNRIT
jgi:hypothetical protein